METLIFYRRSSRPYQIQSRELNGRPHIVVPVVMMREGVHSGSRGALFHSAAELGRVADAWNGIPIVIHHPQINGVFVSANRPDIADQSVGRVFNTRMDGDRLKAEAWLDVQQLAAVSPAAMQSIQSGAPLDVSVGVFSDEIDTPGNWNGEAYIAVAANHRPDHLALLPGDTGACSWNDGCGIRVNSATSNLETNMDSNKKTNESKDVFSVFKELNAEGFSVSLINNAVGLRELVDKARAVVDAMDNDFRVCFLEEVFDDVIVYRIRSRGQNPSERLYRQAYSLEENGAFALVGDPQEVTRTVQYNTLASVTRTKFNNNKKTNEMSQNSVAPCIAGRVDRLINNSATRFEENDRVWLQALSETQLDAMLPKAESAAPDTMNVNAAMDVVRQANLSQDVVLGMLSANAQEEITAGIAMFKQHRESLITKVTAAGTSFTADELGAMNVNMLQKLADAVVKAPVGTSADYSGLGVNTGGEKTQNAGAGNGILLPNLD